MNTSTRRLILALTIVVVIATTTTVFAQETATEALVLKKTYMKSEDTISFFTSTGGTAGPAFTPTIVSCPISSKTCVLRIDVSATFNGLVSFDPNVPAVVAVAEVWVDDSQANILPRGLTDLDSTSTGPGLDARSFTWFTRELPSGLHTVRVDFAVANGGIQAGQRTLTIGVYAAAQPRLSLTAPCPRGIQGLTSEEPSSCEVRVRTGVLPAGNRHLV